MSTIKSSTLQAMIDEVAQDFADAVALKRESLQKSELRKDFPPAKEEEGSESKPDASPASPSPDADGSPDAAPAAPDASAAPAPDASPAPAADPGMGDPAAEAQLDPAALQAEYAKLPPDELEMHLQAAMAAKAALEGAAPAAPAADPAAAAAPPAPAPAPEMKSEGDMEKSAIAKEEMEKSVIAKSEALNKATAKTEELEKLIKTQAEEIAALQAGIQKLVDVPARKAVTTVSHVTREVAAPSVKEWTKESIHSHLTKLSSTPALKKSDRALINDFYCGVVKIDKLAHLFEENK